MLDHLVLYFIFGERRFVAHKPNISMCTKTDRVNIVVPD